MRYPYRHSPTLLLCLFLMALGLALALPAAAQTDLPADLQTLIAEALKANPEVKQMAALHRASQETIPSAGALDDPEVGFSIKDLRTDTWRFNQDPMTQKMLELSQKFPFPGKRRLRSEVAEEQARSDGFSYRDKANEIRAKVILAYWGLSLAQTSFDLTEKNKKLWEQIGRASCRERV